MTPNELPQIFSHISPIYLCDPLGCIVVLWRDLNGKARKQMDEIGDK